MKALNPSTITLLVLAPLLIWRIYSCIRRMVGSQRISRVRLWITLIIFPTLVLFVGRIVYRLVEVYALNGAASPGTAEFARSPLTLAIFGLLAGYYVIYAVGLVRWRNRVLPKRVREPNATDA